MDVATIIYIALGVVGQIIAGVAVAKLTREQGDKK